MVSVEESAPDSLKSFKIGSTIVGKLYSHMWPRSSYVWRPSLGVLLLENSCNLHKPQTLVFLLIKISGCPNSTFNLPEVGWMSYKNYTGEKSPLLFPDLVRRSTKRWVGVAKRLADAASACRLVQWTSSGARHRVWINAKLIDRK